MRHATNYDITKTQRRILDMLSDGKAHKVEALMACLSTSNNRQALRQHIHNLRKHIAPHGEDIVCVVKDKCSWYQHIILLDSGR